MLKILSIDTSSNICGVSILENDKLIKQYDINTSRTHSQDLMPLINKIFNDCNLSIKDINLIVCDIGPGSFTGIRIGISTCMAFADSLDINCVGVNSLEVLAHLQNKDGLICSLIDAKNSNCYFALYELKNGIYEELEKPQANDLCNIFKILEKYNQPICFVGDGAINYLEDIKTTFNNSTFLEKNDIDSYKLGIAGLYKFQNNIPTSILPLYLKKPQAQRQLEEKEHNKTV